MTRAAQFTAAEAAFVLREPVRVVKKALDSGPVRPVLLRRAGASVRAIGWQDLFYLFAIKELRDELTPKARMAFYEALRQAPLERGREVRFGRFRVAVGDLVEEVETRTASLAELAEKVEFRGDGEPVLRGTDVEVHRIAALVDGGLSADDVLVDYPSLSRESVQVATAYAQAHPKAGRPFPRSTAKRALRGAGLDELDEVLDGAAAE